MATINNYEIISQQMHLTENIKEVNVDEIIQTFKTLNTIEKAKEFLKTTLGIENKTKNFFLAKDAFLDFIEHPKFYEIHITQPHKHDFYCYKK